MEKDINDGGRMVPSHCTDDEIDLVQLFQILVKRKKIIFAVTLVCLFLGVGFSFWRKPLYEYTTVIQIGTIPVENGQGLKIIPIESQNSVKLKLEKVYLPKAAGAMDAKYSGQLFTATVKDGKKSNLLFLSSKAGEGDNEMISGFHASVVTSLVENHRELIAASKKQYEILAERAKLVLKDLEDSRLYGVREAALKAKIESGQLALAGIEGQKKILLAKREGLKETKKLLQRQILVIEKNLKQSYAKRDSVVYGSQDESRAMTFLMLNSDILQQERRLAALTERLNVNLKNENQQAEEKLAENQRLRALQETKIEELKGQLVHFLAQHSSDLSRQRSRISAAENKMNLYYVTRALDDTTRSLKPVGPRKSLIVVLSGLLGLMGGVMLAFFMEFMTKVQQREEQKQN